MQEHPQYKITPEQGWSQMQLTLDKVMPVEHRSRRFIVFWWAMVAAIIVTIGSFILLKVKTQPVDLKTNDSPSIEMTSNESQMPDAENQSVSASSPNQNKIVIQENENEGNLLETGTEVTNSSSPLKATTNTSTKVKSKNKSNQNDPIASAYHQNERDKINHQDVVAHKTEVNEKNNPEPSTLLQNQYPNPGSTNEQNALNRNIVIIEFLPVVDAMDYEYTRGNIAVIEPGKHFTSAHKRRLLTPNAAVGGMVGSQNGIGISAGLGTDYAITSKLSISAGVGYRSYRPDAFHWGNSDSYALNEASNALLMNEYLDGEKVNTSADYYALNPFVHSIRQWQINCGLKYEITRRLFMEGGMALGLSTSAKSEYPILKSNSSVVSPQPNIASSFDSYDVIRSNMTSVYGGLGYRLNRHFDFYAQWTHGLEHYLLNDQTSAIGSTEKRTDYMRGLTSGIRFSL